MTTLISQPHTAKIYQFPVGGRASVGPRRQPAQRTYPTSRPITPTASGDCWYHEAAIQDAKRNYEH